MNLLLDTSVLLAACGSRSGASHALFSYHHAAKWKLIAGRYILTEVVNNLPKLPSSSQTEWLVLRPQLRIVRDVVTYRRSMPPLKSKDIPVFATALAWADVLLTLDHEDFGLWIGRTIDGLRILTPSNFLIEQRKLGVI